MRIVSPISFLTVQGSTSSPNLSRSISRLRKKKDSVTKTWSSYPKTTTCRAKLIQRERPQRCRRTRKLKTSI